MFGGLTLKELAQRAWRESNKDNVWGRAAELAFYFLLALFPMLIFLTSLVGFMPGVQDNILRGFAKVAPSEAMKLIRETLRDVVNNRSGGLLSFGLLATLWAASSGVAAVMDTLNAAYNAQEGRAYWKMRLISIWLTVALSVLIIGGTMLIMFGDRFSIWLAAALGLGRPFAITWSVIDYLLGLALVFIGIEVIYYFGPNVKKRWRWITAGGVFAVGMIIICSLLLSLYLRIAPSYSATYGSLGAVVVLMLWLYLVGLVLLMGAEINSQIRQAQGKRTVEKEKPKEETEVGDRLSLAGRD